MQRTIVIQIRYLSDLALYLPSDVTQFSVTHNGYMWEVCYPNPNFK